jgi:cell division septation protein DedD
MNLEKYICSLLYKHECVIVPDFGGFITNYEPARINNTTHAFLPPRMFLVFNSNLKVNDGLLANEVSKAMEYSFSDAMQNIRREVMIWQERLKAGKTITLTGIGTFRTNIAGKTEFTPDPEQNFFDEAFGLTSLVIPPLPKQGQRKRTGFINRRQAGKSSSRALRRMAWAAVITIPLFVAGLWFIFNYDHVRLHATQYSGLVSFFKSEPKADPVNETAAVSETAETTTDSSGSHNEETVPATVEDASGEDASREELAEAMATPAATSTDQPVVPVKAYHIIIGSFEDEINARELAGRMSTAGWNALVVESRRGMYRVSIASHVNKEEALEKLYKIRDEQNPGAWLIRI